MRKLTEEAIDALVERRLPERKMIKMFEKTDAGISYDGPPLTLTGKMKADGNLYRPSYCCQRCGDCVGWIGRLIDGVIGCRWRGCKAPRNP